MTKLNSNVPNGPVTQKWSNYKATCKLVNPANKRKLDIIEIGLKCLFGYWERENDENQSTNVWKTVFCTRDTDCHDGV